MDSFFYVCSVPQKENAQLPVKKLFCYTKKQYRGANLGASCQALQGDSQSVLHLQVQGYTFVCISGHSLKTTIFFSISAFKFRVR